MVARLEIKEVAAENLHIDDLPRATGSAFLLCAKTPFFNNPRWYLAGGTALALQMGHRQSVVAKNQETFECLKRAFEARNIEKRYLALVQGVMRELSGEIKFPIGHGSHLATKRAVKREGRAVRGEREALTLWRLKKQYPSTSSGQAFALLEVEPKTGRTHQIRVHLAAIGHPVAGDSLYGFRRIRPPQGLTRQFLHAAYLDFSLPDGRRFVFESDLPDDLARVVARLAE